MSPTSMASFLINNCIIIDAWEPSNLPVHLDPADKSTQISSFDPGIYSSTVFRTVLHPSIPENKRLLDPQQH